MITIVSGLPGSCKSYWVANEGLKAIRQGRPVWSVFPLAGALKLDLEWMKSHVFPPMSLLLIDEAQLFYNARLWQKMPPETMRYFAQHRHNGVDVIMASQHPGGVDSALRNIAGEFIWLTSWGPPRWREVDSVDPLTGEITKKKRVEKRAMIVRAESVMSYDAWGAIKSEKREDGYHAWWHWVRPSVFGQFDSYDMSQLSGRLYPPVEVWSFTPTKRKRWQIRRRSKVKPDAPAEGWSL